MTRREPFTYDPSVDAAYISLFERQIARTIEITSQIIVDMDAAGQVVGVEIIGLYSLMARVAPEAQP